MMGDKVTYLSKNLKHGKHLLSLIHKNFWLIKKSAETVASSSWSQTSDLSYIRPYFKTIISILYVHTKEMCIMNLIKKDTLIIGRYVKVLNITFMVINLS